jgi:hypothetical protein
MQKVAHLAMLLLARGGGLEAVPRSSRSSRAHLRPGLETPHVERMASPALARFGSARFRPLPPRLARSEPFLESAAACHQCRGSLR